MVVAIAALGLFAVDHGVVEAADVSRGFPDFGVLDDAGFEGDALDALAAGTLSAPAGVEDHVLPPGVAEVLLELGAEGAVVPEAVDSAIDVRG